MKKSKKRLEQKVEETPITEETTSIIEEEKIPAEAEKPIEINKPEEKKPKGNNDDFMGRWKRHNWEVSKWRNVDKDKKNEWFSYKIKVGYKDKKTGEWKNPEINISESAFVNFTVWISGIAQENMKASTQRK